MNLPAKINIITKIRNAIQKRRIFKEIKFSYDNNLQRIIMQLPDTIGFRIEGNVDIQCNYDLNVETLGEINLLGHNDLSMDSLDSKIFLNSYNCRHIRHDPIYIKKREEQEQNNININIHQEQNNSNRESESSLFKKILKLEAKIRRLEEKCT